MARIAVDVVLLPSRAMMEKAIEANRRLPKPSGSKIVLNKESCLPHISLAMGCIEEKDIDRLDKVLQEIAGQYSPLQLKVTDIGVATNSMGEKVSALRIEKSETLQSLHEEVMQELARHFSYDVTAEMVSGAAVSESTLLWIRNYPEKSSFEKFFPHITIGYGEIREFSCPIEFTASELALCHLGNHCTCRKVLASARLQR